MFLCRFLPFMVSRESEYSPLMCAAFSITLKSAPGEIAVPLIGMLRNLTLSTLPVADVAMNSLTNFVICFEVVVRGTFPMKMVLLARSGSSSCLFSASRLLLRDSVFSAGTSGTTLVAVTTAATGTGTSEFVASATGIAASGIVGLANASSILTSCTLQSEKR
jgi:hypothetical protein